jgi:shikimate 5-dehydrogenase
MLVWQGAHAFKLWTDLDAPIDLMFIAAQQALAEVEAA